MFHCVHATFEKYNYKYISEHYGIDGYEIPAILIYITNILCNNHFDYFHI